MGLQKYNKLLLLKFFKQDLNKFLLATKKATHMENKDLTVKYNHFYKIVYIKIYNYACSLNNLFILEKTFSSVLSVMYNTE